MDWYDATEKYHEQTFPHDCRLSSLPEEWQRELAALWRLEADVNNGAYLQFLSNWGRESYVYASQALKKIGARKMAEIIDRCQAVVDEHFPSEGASHEQMQSLMPNPVIGRDGELVKEAGSVLPDSVVEQINELSYEFMNYPDDIATLGLKHYRPSIEGKGPGRTTRCTCRDCMAISRDITFLAAGPQVNAVDRRRASRVEVAENSLQFVPSAVEGLPGVTEAVVFPDRLELLSEGKWVVVRFLDIARWHWLGWLYRPLARLGGRVRGWPMVGERDWFHPPAARFFRFFTQPPITVYMPDEPPEMDYWQTMFWRVQDVMAVGGFGTFDLG